MTRNFSHFLLLKSLTASKIDYKHRGLVGFNGKLRYANLSRLFIHSPAETCFNLPIMETCLLGIHFNPYLFF